MERHSRQRKAGVQKHVYTWMYSELNEIWVEKKKEEKRKARKPNTCITLLKNIQNNVAVQTRKNLG